MEKVLIEEYRGFDIYFDVSSELFQCVCTEESTKESKSFAAVKKFVDEYKKANSNFNPFWVSFLPWGFLHNDSMKTLKILGIRKDGVLVAEKTNGEKIRLDSWDIDQYIVPSRGDQVHLSHVEDLDKEEEELVVKLRARKAEVISKIKGPLLREYIKRFS